jgi:hypothetical protein
MNGILWILDLWILNDVLVDFDYEIHSRSNQEWESNIFRPATLTFPQPRNISSQRHSSRVISGGYYDILADVESTHDDPLQEYDTSTYASSERRLWKTLPPIELSVPRLSTTSTTITTFGKFHYNWGSSSMWLRHKYSIQTITSSRLYLLSTSRGLFMYLGAIRALCSHFIFSNFKNFQSIIFLLFYENGSEKNESIMPLYYFKFKQNYESIMIKKLSS